MREEFGIPWIEGAEQVTTSILYIREVDGTRVVMEVCEVGFWGFFLFLLLGSLCCFCSSFACFAGFSLGFGSDFCGLISMD